MTNTSQTPVDIDCFQSLRDHIYADYEIKTTKSRSVFEKAKTVMPGGVSGNLRFFPPYPLYMQSGAGSKIIDVDGNSYIDCFSANGPLLLGHNHPALVSAQETVRDYGLLPLNPPLMVECAELITRIVPCAEKVRFLNTGTEAVMTAVRVARAHTGKAKILKFYGHYHGQQDPFLFGMDSTGAIFSDGVPCRSITDTLVCRYDDIEALTSVFESDDDIAAVILDPAMHAGGLWGSNKDYLEALRKITKKYGALLIFDEVITGFRLGLGGAQEYYGVTPDLVTMAKAAGGGEKIAIVAGSAEVMSVVDPEAPAGTPRVFQSGTVNDGSFALAATLAALKTYQELDKKGAYQNIERRAERLKFGIEAAFAKRSIHCQVNHLASMLQLFITPNPVTFESSQGLNFAAEQLFYHALINEGVLLSLPTSNHIYLSFAHTDSDIDFILDKIEDIFERYAFEKVLLS